MSRVSLLVLLVPLILGFADEDKPPAKKSAEPPKQPAITYRFAPPVRLQAAGKPIDTAVGHAAPLAVDFDGDGKTDLLVGQFGEGLLLFYRNVGTNTEPRYTAGMKVQADGKDVRVPAG